MYAVGNDPRGCLQPAGEQNQSAIPDNPAAAGGLGVRKPSICFVTYGVYPILAGRREIALVGGAEVQQAQIARELACRGFAVSLISVDYGQTEGEVIAGVRQFKSFPEAAGWPGLRFFHPRLNSVWAAMRRANADIYYYRTLSMTVAIVAAFCRSQGRRSIYAGAHDMDFGNIGPAELKFPHNRVLYRWGINRVDHIVAQSERQLDMCRKRYAPAATVIRSCYSHIGRPAEFDGPILWCATVKEHKQPHLFLELAARLPDLQFRLVGGPPQGSETTRYHEELRQQALALPNVELTGFVPYADVERQFDGAAVFVNTSIGEGFPNTFLQAWSRGMPSVSFFDPQSSLEGRSVGRVARNLDEMATHVRELKRNYEKWRNEGHLAKALAEQQHSMRSVGDAYEHLLLSLHRDKVTDIK